MANRLVLPLTQIRQNWLNPHTNLAGVPAYVYVCSSWSLHPIVWKVRIGLVFAEVIRYVLTSVRYVPTSDPSRADINKSEQGWSCTSSVSRPAPTTDQSEGTRRCSAVGCVPHPLRIADFPEAMEWETTRNERNQPLEPRVLLTYSWETYTV